MWQLIQNYSLLDNEVHIFRVKISSLQHKFQDYFALLSEEEKETALRYKFEKDRIRSVISRSQLRMLLAKYLNLSPQEILFTISKHGKLYLTDEINSLKLQFNVSHSADVIVYGFTKHVDIGIDVEFPKDQTDYKGLAKRFFSQKEQENLLSLQNEHLRAGFYHIWTRKESYIKALGAGLSYPLDAFSVSLSKDDVKLIEDKLTPDEVSQWSMASFTPYENYFAAMATKQRVNKIKYYDLD